MKQVQKMRTALLKVRPDHASLAAGDLAQGYQDWLRFRLAQIVKAIDRGEMPSYPAKAAKAILQKRLAARRANQAKPAL